MAWEHGVVAHNTATQSTNRMHDDTVAAGYGFAGGLVPGVDVWAYLTRPCIDRWGLPFVERGIMDVRFSAPVYDGERVQASLDEDGILELRGPDGTVRATGTAALVHEGDLPAPVEIDEAEVPDPVPDATPSLLAPGTVLGRSRFTYRRDVATRYLDDIRETSPIYDHGAVGHPGMLARQANHVLAGSVRLGPWIHVSTSAWHRGVVRHGQTVETRGVVVDEREHKGHRFVDLDVEVTADRRPVWSARHTAIWQPRRPEEMVEPRDR